MKGLLGHSASEGTFGTSLGTEKSWEELTRVLAGEDLKFWKEGSGCRVSDQWVEERKTV